MNCEQRRDKTASPHVSSHLPQYKKQKNDGHRVQKHVSEMMPGRIESVELAIQHVRNRCQRVPVTGCRMRKGPRDPCQRQPCGDVRIRVNILRIVVRYELVR